MPLSTIATVLNRKIHDLNIVALPQTKLAMKDIRQVLQRNGLEFTSEHGLLSFDTDISKRPHATSAMVEFFDSLRNLFYFAAQGNGLNRVRLELTSGGCPPGTHLRSFQKKEP